MKILKNILLVLLSVIAGYFSSVFFGDLYQKIFNVPDTWIDMRGVAGLPLAYIFFLFLIFTAFGGEGKTKYWWMGILAIPALIFEIYFDFSHICFPIVLGLIGWLIGLGIQKLVKQIRH